MSESAPESGGGSFDSAFSRRYGPLTGLQWTGIAVAGGGLYIWYRNKHAASTASSSSSGQATAYGYTGQPYDYGPSIAAQQSEIQALQSGSAQTRQQRPPTNTTGTSTGTARVIGPAQPISSSLYTVRPGASQSGTVPNVTGETLSQAVQTLQGAGYGVSSASYNYQNLNTSNAGQFGNTRVVSYTPQGNSVALGLW